MKVKKKKIIHELESYLESDNVHSEDMHEVRQLVWKALNTVSTLRWTDVSNEMVLKKDSNK